MHSRSPVSSWFLVKQERGLTFSRPVHLTLTQIVDKVGYRNQPASSVPNNLLPEFTKFIRRLRVEKDCNCKKECSSGQVSTWQAYMVASMVGMRVWEWSDEEMSHFLREWVLSQWPIEEKDKEKRKGEIWLLLKPPVLS